MTKKEQIRKRLQEIAAQFGPVASLIAKVVSVDESELTCVVEEDGVEIPGVRLRPVINGQEGITVIPHNGSWVALVRLEDEAEWMVLAVDRVKKYRIVNGTMLFEMDNGKFTIKNGTVNLGKALDDLIIEIQAIYAPKNAASIAAIQVQLKQLLNGA